MASHDANAVAGPSEAVSDWDSDIDDEFEQDDETTLGRTVGNGSGRTAAKRSRSSTVDSELQSSKPKRKRNRAALSCAPCKKRKIKCDRKLPCESCIKRGEQGTCRWEQPKVEPPPQIFALAVEHEQLKRRVAVLEEALARLAPGVLDGAGAPILPVPPTRPGKTARQRSGTIKTGAEAHLLSQLGDGGEEEEEEAGESDHEVVEDAAQVLKTLAAQKHHTRSSSRSGRLRSGTPQSATLPHPPPVPPVSTLNISDSRFSASERRLGSPLRQSTTSASGPSRATQPVGTGTARDPTGGDEAGRAGSNTPEPIDEVAARAMASLLCGRPSRRAPGSPGATARESALDVIYADLPQRKAETDWMLHNYFTRVDWAWHLHHKPTFLAEYEAYSILRYQGRQYSIDPLWLAYFALTLALSVKSLEAPISTPLLSITGRDLDELPGKFVRCAVRALECGEWRRTPRFRTVQAIVLFAPYYLFTGNATSMDHHKFYLTTAIEMAQALGLHELGSDPRTMPAIKEEDEAHAGFPAGTSSLKREMALRLLSTLLFLDYTSIRSTTLLPPHLVTSALPGNYNDVDLAPEGIVPPRPDHLATDTSLDLVRHRIALEQYHFKEGLGARNGEGPTYEAVLATDARYQAILDDIPTDLSEAYIPPLGEPLMTLWRRSAVVQGIHSRILRLHRPYIARGRVDEKYRFSTERAVGAARVILATQVSLSSAPLLRGAFQLVNIQLAVLVLFSTLWQSSSSPARRDEEEDVALITSIFGWLERHAGSRVTEIRLVASSSLKAFRLLMSAYEERKTRQTVLDSSAWSSLGGADGDGESFGNALSRISALVNVPDLLASGAEDEAMYVTPAAISAQSTPGAAGNMSLDSLLAPNQLRTGLSSSCSSTHPTTSFNASPFGASTPLRMKPHGAPSNDATSFDRTLLEGLEFGDPSFSWSTWSPLGPFATLGTY